MGWRRLHRFLDSLELDRGLHGRLGFRFGRRLDIRNYDLAELNLVGQ